MLKRFYILIIILCASLLSACVPYPAPVHPTNPVLITKDSYMLGQNLKQGRLSAKIRAGSLRVNVKHIVAKDKWTLVWKAHVDYDWVGPTVIRANSISGLIGKLLADYPLQAVFYHGNHVVVVRPRVI